jgi:hypothetical protein
MRFGSPYIHITDKTLKSTEFFLYFFQGRRLSRRPMYLGYLSRYGDRVLAGGSGLYFRQGQESFLSSTLSGPVQGPTQPLTKWALARSPGSNAARESS